MGLSNDPTYVIAAAQDIWVWKVIPRASATKRTSRKGCEEMYERVMRSSADIRVAEVDVGDVASVRSVL